MKRKISLFLLIFVALFTLVCANVKVSAAGEWELVTDASTLAVGDQIVITNKTATHALGNDRGNNRAGIAITKSGTTISITDEVEVILLEDGKVEGTFAFKVDDGFLYAGSSSGNQLKTKTSLDVNGSWAITISSGTANINAPSSSNRSVVQYNPNNGTPIFACYSSASQTAVSIYKRVIQADNLVNQLFTKYHNKGTYIKESVLNVNPIAQEEVKSYFHAGADVRFRKTVYLNNPELSANKTTELTMYTATEEGKYNLDNWSKYEDKDNQVYHTGLNNPYYHNVSSVEDWFVTLEDFMNNGATGWQYDAGKFVYELNPITVSEQSIEMSRMAREFVAPMWLDTAAAKSYVTFDKLVVEENGDTLIMKLYVTSTNSGALIEGSDLVFSQVSIKKAYFVSVEEGENYTLDCNKYVLAENESISINVNVNDGYEVSDVTTNGVTVNRNDNIITLSNPISNATIKPIVTEKASISFVTIKYSMSSYPAGTQYAKNENHELDDKTTLTINGAHLNTQIRLYAGSNCIFTSDTVIDQIKVTAGNKADSLKVYGSIDGKTWVLVTTVKTTTNYTQYSVKLGYVNNYRYVKLESTSQQIRISIIELTSLA